MGQGPEIQVEFVLNSNKTLGILPWWCLIDLSPIISSANGRFRPYDFSRLLQSHCLFMWPHFFTEAQWWESTCTSAICFCSYVSSTYNVFFLSVFWNPIVLFILATFPIELFPGAFDPVFFHPTPWKWLSSISCRWALCNNQAIFPTRPWAGPLTTWYHCCVSFRFCVWMLVLELCSFV